MLSPNTHACNSTLWMCLKVSPVPFSTHLDPAWERSLRMRLHEGGICMLMNYGGKHVYV